MVVQKILGYKVKTLPDKKMGGYEGMNYYAGKKMGFKPVIKDPHIIIIDSLYKGEKKTQIIKHEIHEAELMKKGHTYFYSHQMANKVERKPYCKCLERK